MWYVIIGGLVFMALIAQGSVWEIRKKERLKSPPKTNPDLISMQISNTYIFLGLIYGLLVILCLIFWPNEPPKVNSLEDFSSYGLDTLKSRPSDTANANLQKTELSPDEKRSYSVSSLKTDIQTEMSANGYSCLDVSIQGECVWVATLDRGDNLDGLAATLCYKAKEHGYRCVSLFDPNLKKLGKSICD